MKKTIYLLFIGLGLYVGTTSAQSSRLEEYKSLGAKRDTLGQQALLQRWEKDAVNDADLYLAYFSFYLSKAQSKPKNADYFLARSIFFINTAIEKAPNRLDLRIYKLNSYSNQGDYEKMTMEAINTIDYGYNIQNAWLWSDNKPFNKQRDVMLQYLSKYVDLLFDKNMIANAKRICETQVKYYPNVVGLLTRYSLAFSYEKQYDQAIAILLRAEKISPDEHVVAMNIGDNYVLKGDKANALKYFNLALSRGNAEQKKEAQAKIDLLQKN